ncbi:MAG: transporter associated domain-containing protein [Desulfovibrionaceae bacterium]|nr:transporter associated domain-containing protein [Desulfovibrionaceae bacterium]
MAIWDFAWVTDPSAWAGLGTLILIEIVLGIDNIVFISILASTLPKSQRKHAFIAGLGLALVARLALLAGVAWVVTLTQPIFELFGHNFSWRDCILIFGGVFLLLKGTMEMHERLEGQIFDPQKETKHQAVFWQVIAQIVILDAIFSIDSVITSVGMVQHLPIMYMAVICAVGFMLLASGPLVAFIERHPTIIILCLGFLLMIGLSLITDGIGMHIPKGYLYTAILFSLLIEFCNQYALRNRRRRVSMRDMREATARVILGLLGGKTSADSSPMDALALSGVADGATFAPEERDMVGRVIRLSGRTARFIMTPAQRAPWLGADATFEEAEHFALRTGLSWLPVRDMETDDVLGVVPVSKLIRRSDAPFALKNLIQSAPTVLEHTSLADVLADFRSNPVPLLFVVDEYGTTVGQILPANLISVLAGQMGDLPASPDSCRMPDGSWKLPGRLSVDMAISWLGINPGADSESATLAGLILEKLQHIPQVGEKFQYQGWQIEVTRMDGRRIDEVRAVQARSRKRS